LIDYVKVLGPTQHEIGHFGGGSSQPISWPSTKETKRNTTTANNTGTK